MEKPLRIGLRYRDGDGEESELRNCDFFFLTLGVVRFWERSEKIRSHFFLVLGAIGKSERESEKIKRKSKYRPNFRLGTITLFPNCWIFVSWKGVFGVVLVSLVDNDYIHDDLFVVFYEL